MAIVKMKRIRAIAMASRREELLQGLLHLGCVEISEPDGRLADPRWSALLGRGTSRLVSAKEDISNAETARTAIEKYAQIKGKLLSRRRTVTEAEFLSDGAVDHAKAVSLEVDGLLQTLSRLQGEESRLLARQAALQPWKSLDMDLSMEGTAHAVFRTGVLPGGADVGAIRVEIGASDAAAELLEIGADKQQKYCLLLCHRADEARVMELLRPHGFSVTTFQGIDGTPAEELGRLDGRLEEVRRQQDQSREAIAGHGVSQDALQLYADRLRTEESREANAERLMTDGTIVFFEGWAPAEKMADVGALLDRLGCAWEAADPTEEELPDVPVSLKNNWFTRPLNMVTDMYSLPSYNSVDPNPLMAPFFILFYGMMMADMGYGLLMAIASVVIMKKSDPNGPTMRHMIPLLGLCGVSTFIWGALTGGFFGDFLTQIVKLTTGGDFALPALFSPLNDAVPVLIGSLILGVCQVFTGMAVSMVKQIRRGETVAALCNEGAWFLVFILAGLCAAGVLTLKVTLIAALVVLILTQSYGKKGFAKITGVFGSLYNGITGYFSDILSYSRLMALMLAGAVVAQVFNQLGAMTGNVIAFILIAAIGNALNFALNLLGCYVHDMRLQCLEFFGRFYEDGGKPFRPLEIGSKYVDVERQ